MQAQAFVERCVGCDDCRIRSDGAATVGANDDTFGSLIDRDGPGAAVDSYVARQRFGEPHDVLERVELSLPRETQRGPELSQLGRRRGCQFARDPEGECCIVFFLQRFERRGVTRYEKAVQSAEIAVDALAHDDGFDQIDGGTEALDDLPRTLIAEAS